MSIQAKIRYVYRDVDRHGKVRFYFRRRAGEPKILMPDPGSPEFMSRYAAALAGKLTPVPPRLKQSAPAKAAPAPTSPAAKTLGWLATAYMASGEFASLNERTRYVRRGILDHCLKEPITPGDSVTYAEVPLSEVTPKAVRVLRDRKAKFPEAANSRVKALRQVFAWGVENEEDVVKANPARDVTYLTNASEGFKSWTIEEVRKYEEAHPIGSTARLAMALLLYTGQRRSDVVRMGPADVKGGWITLTQQKNRDRKPVTLTIPIVRPLQEIIDATPTGLQSFLVTALGKPFTANGFGNRFRKWCNEAGLKDCSAHGLRKAAAARLAEAGCTDREIMAITGHTTVKEVDRYTKGARQKLMAESAMLKLVKG